MRGFLLLLAGGLAACRPLPIVPAPAPSWRLVEVDVVGGKELVLEIEESVSSWRIETRLAREQVRTSEVVEAEVWLAGAHGPHRIEIRPSRPEVRIDGPCEFTVQGEERVNVRFTCSVPGRGGILVVVKD